VTQRRGHRQALLAAAKRCLYEQGYARTSARDLVAASGTNLGSIGYHFGSKEALLTTAMIAAIGEWGDALEQVLAAEADPAASPIERFEATWTRVIETFVDYRPVWVASFEALVQAERSPEVRASLAAAIERARIGLVALFQQVEEPIDEHTARTVGSFYQALLSGVMVQWLLDPERAPSGRDLAEALKTIAGSVGPAGTSGETPP
jgi:AcrR family transcriptional regulator